MVCQRSILNSIASCDGDFFIGPVFWQLSRTSSYRVGELDGYIGGQAMRVYAISLRVSLVTVAMVAILAFGVSLPAHAQNMEWVRQFGTSTWDEGLAVAKGPSGVYVTGDTLGSFPGQTLASPGKTD